MHMVDHLWYGCRGLLLITLLLTGLSHGQAQRRTVVVADAMTRQPIAHASLYTKENGRFRSCISDETGKAVVAFDFRRLTLSHLNYEQRVVSRLTDTLFMEPRYQQMSEVVVTSEEPEWIRRKLRQAVKTKEQAYFSVPSAEHFAYTTQSIGNNSLYRLQMTGMLQMKSRQHRRYALSADTARIVAADSTLLTDTSNLRRMLYEDFMAELDNAFIRQHRFYESADRKGCGDDDVRLRFRSKENSNDDRGWLIVDTARCIVRQASRYTGTKTNRRERTDAFLYGFARLMGYHIDRWTRDYYVGYAERSDGTLYPAEVRYKFYYAGRDYTSDKRSKEFSEQTGGGFPNMEATLLLTPAVAAPTDSTLWMELPPSWYIAYMTDADRRKEIELSNLPARFTLYDNEQEQ